MQAVGYTEIPLLRGKGGSEPALCLVLRICANVLAGEVWGENTHVFFNNFIS